MTTTHVGLLRAINVGGVTIPMARLRELATGLGWSDVATHLATGNLLLGSSEPEEVVATRLADALRVALGRDVPVVVRTPAELSDVLERVRPLFPAAATGRVHIAFLDRDPGADADARLGEWPPEEHVRIGRELALHYPNGLGRSKLTTAVMERRLGIVATVRGLRTIEGILARAAGDR